MNIIRPKGKIIRPPVEKIGTLAQELYMNPSDEELNDLLELSDGLLNEFDRLDELVEPVPETEFPIREADSQTFKGRRPLNLFITKCIVHGSENRSSEGKESGAEG